MQEKHSWDDIPTLEIGDREPVNDFVEQRGNIRLSTQDIKEILANKSKVIWIRVATPIGVLPEKGILQDIHHKGLCFSMPDQGVKINDTIMIGGMIGERLFKCKAIVRWQSEEKTGVEFVDASDEDKTYFKDLYSAKIFKDLT